LTKRKQKAHYSVEIVNINPENEPEWFLKKSPLGRIPAFEMNSSTIYESSVIVEYLDEVFPDTAILPQNPLAKAKQKILVERMKPVVYCYNNEIKQAVNVDKSLHNALHNANDLLLDDFFAGRTMGYADIMIWPFLERSQLVTINPFTQFRYFPGVNYPKIGAYMARMQRQPEVMSHLSACKVNE
ncbi:unnamed protein product, partial [Thelazia callipaeda]|uniref:Glutathione S-transferase omega n=1 Tax=Thelazia callipaeda TaxID=103827 RepID=A0A0N5D982_THECL